MAKNESFKQFSFFIDNLYEPKKKNRFMLHIPSVPQLDLGSYAESLDGGAEAQDGLLLSLISASRPEYSIETTEIDRYNEKAYWASKPSHSKEMSCEFNDYIDNSGDLADSSTKTAAVVIYRWYNTIYNLALGSMGFKKEYAVPADLYLLDPHGDEIEHWHYTNFYPLSVNYNDVNMTDTGACTISSTFKYDKVRLIKSKDTSQGEANDYSSHEHADSPQYEESGAF